MLQKEDIAAAFRSLQDDICRALEQMDGTSLFHEDAWEMATGGGGRTRIIQGEHIEKGGVNFSAVEGPASEALKKLLGESGDRFFATGVSIVLHPSSPLVPIIHMNVRYFEMSEKVWWFGGGIDLTPHYIDKDEAQNFHRQLKETCDRTDSDYYPRFKKWADDYFYLKHRQETRGVGGIFFDRLNTDRESKTKAELFEFVMNVGRTFVPAYRAVFESNVQRDWTDSEKQWQYYRRGRYVEFNLVWDRGTRFGLETGGRTESILMSLPAQARWQYDFQPEEGTPEAETQNLLRKGIEWIG